jgi:hypothetical protein
MKRLAITIFVLLVGNVAIAQPKEILKIGATQLFLGRPENQIFADLHRDGYVAVPSPMSTKGEQSYVLKTHDGTIAVGAVTFRKHTLWRAIKQYRLPTDASGKTVDTSVALAHVINAAAGDLMTTSSECHVGLATNDQEHFESTHTHCGSLTLSISVKRQPDELNSKQQVEVYVTLSGW